MAQHPSYDVALQSDNLFSDARIELIRNTVAKNAPDDVFAAMIDIARRRNLDPLAKQISVIPFKGVYQIVTTIDGYRALSAQTGTDAGMDPPVYTWPDEPEFLENGERNPAVFTKSGKRKPESCTVTVYKLIDGQRYPFAAMVWFDEYDTGINRWDTAPKQMSAKVAESMARRMAWPSVTSGTYVEEEMDQAIETTARVAESRHRPSSPAPTPQRARQQPRQIAPPAPAPAPGGDGKAVFWRKKLGDFAAQNTLSDADLDAAAHERFDAPLDALVGDDLETLHKELAEIKRAGDLASVIAGLRGEQPAAEEIDPETGEVIPPRVGTTQVTIDLPEDAVSESKRKAAAATAR